MKREDEETVLVREYERFSRQVEERLGGSRIKIKGGREGDRKYGDGEDGLKGEPRKDAVEWDIGIREKRS
jgi:hypothetical protein